MSRFLFVPIPDLVPLNAQSICKHKLKVTLFSPPFDLNDAYPMWHVR